MDTLTSSKIPVFREGISNRHLNLTTLKEYGVKYVIIFKEGLDFHYELANLSKIYEQNNFLILEIPDVKSYVFYEGGDIKYTSLENGFSFDTSFDKEEDVTINLLYKKGYICKINGEKISYIQDSFGRMVINVPSGENQIIFVYSPKDFINGCLISLFLIFVLILIFKFRKYLDKWILNIPFKSFFRFIFKNKWKILFLFILLSIILVFISIVNKQNLENSFENKFGAKLDIGKINLGINKIVLYDVTLYQGNRENFYSSEISFRIDYVGTLDYVFTNKRFIILFKEIKFSNISANFLNQKNSNNLCDSLLNISSSYPLTSLNSFNLTKNSLNIYNGQLALPNKFLFSFQGEYFNISSYNIIETVNVSVDLVAGRYVSGEIIIEDTSFSEQFVKEEKQSCLILPLEVQNNVFY